METAKETAKRFLKMGKLSSEEIADGTGLPLEEVKAVRKAMERKDLSPTTKPI